MPRPHAAQLSALLARDVVNGRYVRLSRHEAAYSLRVALLVSVFFISAALSLEALWARLLHAGLWQVAALVLLTALLVALGWGLFVSWRRYLSFQGYGSLQVRLEPASVQPLASLRLHVQRALKGADGCSFVARLCCVDVYTQQTPWGAAQRYAYPYLGQPQRLAGVAAGNMVSADFTFTLPKEARRLKTATLVYDQHALDSVGLDSVEHTGDTLDASRWWLVQLLQDGLPLDADALLPFYVAEEAPEAIIAESDAESDTESATITYYLNAT